MNVFPASLILAATDVWVYILPTLGSILLAFGIYQVIAEGGTSQAKRMQERLRGDKVKRDKTASTLLRRTTGQGGTFADLVVGKFKFIPQLQTLLDQADVEWSASQMLLNLSIGAILTALVLVAVQVNVAAAIGCGGGIVILPLCWLSFRRKRRMSKLNEQLPDVFEMMGQALRAGHSLAGAVQTVYEQMPAPIATEFAQVYHEQNLGVKIEDALQSMADRVDSLDVRFFVTAVMIQRQTGGDLAEVLDNISGVIRERIELAGLVRGLTAEGRLSGWVLFALPTLVFVASMYLNPKYAQVLLEDPRGQIMLLLALGMQLMGIAMIRWIVNIKV